MLQTKIRNCEAIQDLLTNRRVFIVNKNDNEDANEDLFIDDSLFANPYFIKDDLTFAQQLFSKLKKKNSLSSLHRS